MSAIPLEVEHVDEPAEGVPLNQLPQVITITVCITCMWHIDAHVYAQKYTEDHIIK